MLEEVREGNNCYSDAELEISTADQWWDKESLKELKEDHHIFFMSKSDAAFPVQVIFDETNKPQSFRFGVEDDGTVFFGENIGVHAHVLWIDSLIKDLQAAKKFIESYE